MTVYLKGKHQIVIIDMIYTFLYLDEIIFGDIWLYVAMVIIMKDNFTEPLERSKISAGLELPKFSSKYSFFYNRKEGLKRNS